LGRKPGEFIVTRRHSALQPSIDRIEARLFGVTDGLVRAVKAGKTSARISEAVKVSPEWQDYHRAGTELSPQAQGETASIAMPEYLRDLIARRVNASNAKFSTVPTEGQIVEVTRIVTPENGQLDWEMTVPLYVLLDRPAETDELWSGWFVASETDYATSWDFVLQEQDEPFDPEVGMVQVWNPVRFYLPMAGRVVAELRPDRLAAVRALAVEFLLSEERPEKPWPGHVATRETYGGYLVVTGSPKGGPSDPRHRYQNMYHYAAEAIREPAALALARESAFKHVASIENIAKGAPSNLDPLVDGYHQTTIEQQEAISDALQDREWFGKARYEILSSRHIRFHSRLIPDHQIDLQLFWRGRPLLTQTYGKKRVDWPIRIEDTTIDFRDGLSELSLEQLHTIATQAGLPGIYSHWGQSVQIRATLGALGSILDETQRGFVKSLIGIAEKANESLGELLLPPLSVQIGGRRGRAQIAQPEGEKMFYPKVQPIVIDINVVRPKRSLLEFRWIEHAPAEIQSISAMINGHSVDASINWIWRADNFLLLEAEPLDIDETFKAGASWDPATKGLRLEFLKTSE
jgi:hypothetical protein